jgi:hypothetical protein
MVYLRMYEGNQWLECELYDEPFVQSKGQIPPELHIICPYCGGESVIPPSGDPTKKTVKVEYISPRFIEMPDNGERVVQTALVSVEEVCQCNHPAPNGKGRCGWKFQLRDGVLSRV